MRGLVLSHPAVAAVLKPFLVTWWEGPDDRVPQSILELERYAPPFERRTNVTAFVVAPDGTVVLGTSPFPGHTPFEGEPGAWFAQQVAQALTRMNLGALPPAPARTPLRRATPTLTPPGQVRAFVRITGDPNVNAPLVETVPMTAAAWSALKWPAQPRTVDAAVAAPWLVGVYPPAMMDQESRVSQIAGQLELKADGARTAVLSGEVALTLPAAQAFRSDRFRDTRRNPVDLTFRARVEVVLTYPDKGELPVDIQGLVRARYPRPGPQGPPILEATIEAAP